MKTKKLLSYFVALFAVAALGTSCTTYYDACGRPVQAIDPGAAVALAAAAGIAGYALSNGHRHGGGHHAHHGHGGHHH